MRGWVKSAYPSKKWKDKVNKMPDSQVLAVYQRLVNAGKIKN